ncbi:tyrosine--tRNA ligase [Clostridium thermosuccinogenes]|uniref:Tyrosine--tRNA ligase n=1 Tax=Clostridium thermosuccinogenes TaxID=84032 RepID=A0A2K2F414_9CLOT|nr:tyrosine--tRNA ligase [Pseudoclostridium thermosuccinogenes]AUS95759.1 tyrosine--tRNA ligase [Pseudoclostridium thermosuccinogenes]PNT93522.1 tyrosine--tRNA ligase [Pseudoclostridium thermosuccinogenes]PNT99881.1 tyrosine--tRNA ligase [Pseudoclostridium thermosuccinogenes]PNU01326.1 tyrosine--tRNA ligase [Pseudoclostridium thermosuccinogenes]
MGNVYDVLKERGFIQQVTHEEPVRELLGKEKVTFYIGFDATADSLHVGHFLQLMVMAHMQKAGHRPIALIGGGTTMVGDPTGKTDMRKMLTREEIQANSEKFKAQISKFIDFSDGKAIMVDNADWLLNLNYIEFLREIGVHFSVNRMLTAECFKSRLEGKGLSFIEFNYMLMQSYDFLVLYRKYGCVLELGGDDQWSNIIGGVELIRRVEGKDAYGMTFTLLTNSEGKKMGKTEKGALWLDPNKTSPYDFYQYWRNVPDSDVEKCLALLTFLPMDEVRRLGSLKDAEINEAKKVLAYEVTRIVHGEEEAIKAQKAAEALFGGAGDMSSIPSVEVSEKDLEQGIKLIDLAVIAGLTPSKSEARRAIQQGGMSVNGKKVTDIDTVVGKADLEDGHILLQRGKKSFCRVVVK